MNLNLLFDNNLIDYSILIGCGLILSFSLYYLIRNNYTAIPSNNKEAFFTKEEIDAIIDENMQPISNANIENFITDSDFETDVASDYQRTFDSMSTSDIESILEDQNLFFMPNVDLDICPIEELKLYE
jgi:hypothetical protein